VHFKFNSNTSYEFQTKILGPFLAHYLKDSVMDVAPVNAYLTGANRWERLNKWPSGCNSGCTSTATPFYLNAGMRAGFAAPTAAANAFDEYVSDPAKPVPYRSRPSQPTGYVLPLTWPRWLVDDQREPSGRPDVLTYTSTCSPSPCASAGSPWPTSLPARPARMRTG